MVRSAIRLKLRAVNRDATEETASAAREEAASTELLELRTQIDAVNDEILRSLEKRGDLVLQVMRLKSELGKPVVDATREREMLDRIAAKARGAFSAADIKRIFRAIISASRGLARRLTD